MEYFVMFNTNNTTGVTNKAGTSYPSGVLGFTFDF